MCKENLVELRNVLNKVYIKNKFANCFQKTVAI